MSHKVLVEFVFDCDSDKESDVRESLSTVIISGAESYYCFAHSVSIKSIELWCEECNNKGCIECKEQV
jgi:hypothetical protein